MVTKTVVIGSAVGLHARPASVFSKTAKTFDSKVSVKFGDRSVNGKSAIHLITLNAKFGSAVQIIVDGQDEVIALEKLSDILEDKDL